MAIKDANDFLQAMIDAGYFTESERQAISEALSGDLAAHPGSEPTEDDIELHGQARLA
jgi:hypothetical protein